MECLFCAAVAGEAAVHEVSRDGVALAFLDHRPLFPGHVLVVPVPHAATLTDLPDELVGPFFTRVRAVTAAVEQATAAAGSFVAMNNRVSQSVPHLHVHVVPRHRGDGLRGFFWPRGHYPTEAAALETAARIRAALRQATAVRTSDG
ncbi:HIT family protein [Kitasatospora sp. NPDC052896]|uniref:HIT family protein n=1 Tax=Kitasatospora sp. NPDC052896 TaxID=3364061 RepID=UPI0037C7325F